MTSPPPSETGPSAEAVIAGQSLAWWALEVYRLVLEQNDVGPLLLAIWRSAHLEDARALEQAAYAITELERCLRAYVTPIGGMGSNIQREDRGRAAQALREAAKFREVWDALSLTGGPARTHEQENP